MDILNFWHTGINAFIEDGFAWNEYLVLLIISILYLYNYWRKKSRYVLIHAPILLFVVLLNPISTYITSKFFPLDAYYGRLVNLIPIVYIIASCAVCFVGECEKKQNGEKSILYLAITIVILLAGESMYYNKSYESRFVKAENHMHLPQYVVDAVDAILASSEKKDEIKVVVPWEYTLYIRQYSADIKLGWGRFDWLDDEVVVNNYNMTELDIQKFVNYIKEKGCNYIVFPNVDENTEKQFIDMGCTYITTDTNNSNIYKIIY